MPGQTNPVRDAVRAEILEALSGGQSFMSHELYSLCQSAVDPKDVARVAHELVKKGLLVNGEKAPHPLGMSANTYKLPTGKDPRIEAAKPIKMEPTIKKNRQPAQKRKPPADHPFQASIRPQEAHDGAPRVTRPLPMHLTTSAPQMAAVAIDETEMSEEPMPYVTEPDDTFNQEPMEPEAPEDIDSVLVDALMGLAHLEPKDAEAADVLAMASADVGEIAAAMGKKPSFDMPQEPLMQVKSKPHCQCLRLPPLPKGYVYGGLKVWIETRHDVGHLTITTYDGGGGPFYSLKANGHLNFDTGDLVTIGQVADALIKLHQDMSHE